MGRISCHGNQSSYPISTNKNNIFAPPPPPPLDALCQISKVLATQLQRRCHLKLRNDGQTTEHVNILP